VEGGALWLAMHARPRRDAGTLVKAVIPVEPGVYAWYRNDSAIYVGKADRLQDRLWKHHLGQGRAMTSSAFRRNVAEHLGISTSASIKTRAYELDTDELLRVRKFVDTCQVAWLVCGTKAGALDLETRMKNEWKPPLTKM
jgi:excinuclease UvrABC nuclease subunit